MPQKSRQRIIECLKREGQASVRELGKSLGLTTVTIRHHLEVLMDAGIVSAPSKRKKAGRGRPEMVYRLSEDIHEYLPSNLATLGVHIVEALVESLKPIELSALLRQAGAHAAASAGLPSGIPLGERLQGALEYLNASGYMAASVRVEEFLELEFSNCPYYRLACQVPILCMYDQALVETSLDLPMRLNAQIIHHNPVCSFVSSNTR
jgi:predicted ArsR family transcriptional regulator